MNFSAALFERLKAASAVCVLTGAGISAESGVPTFRGPEGLWSKFRPEELASFDAFIRNPRLVWEWYTYRKKVMQEVQPNDAHRALVVLQDLFADFTLVTQNVDNLHQRAGSRKVLELHGNLERSYCIDCRRPASNVTLGDGVDVPRCSSCGGLLRPDVVWFGEVLPQRTFMEAQWSAEHSDVFLTIGTSGIVYPAAWLPLGAREAGSYVVEINTEYTDLSPNMSETIIGKAAAVLPELVRLLQHKN